MDKKAFEEAAEKSKLLKNRPSNVEILKLYALFKQATEGNVSCEKPGGFDFKAAAKYNAWEEQKGKSSDSAAEEYIQFVNELIAKDK
jgi:acyl-CoA-binding protein